MSKAMQYVNFALGSTGFAVINPRIAFRLAPNLWSDGMDCSYDFSNKALPGKLSTVQDVQVYLARFADIPGGLIKVLTRNPDQLAERIGWVTGSKPALLVHESEMEGQLDPADIPPRKVFPSESTEGGDLHAGVVTAEPPRTCLQCEWAAQGNIGCRNAEESGIRFPALNAPRRCLAFRPRFDSYDGRLGTALWPEIVTKP